MPEKKHETVTFEALGLSSELVDDYFAGTWTQIEGVGLDEERRSRLGLPPDLVG